MSTSITFMVAAYAQKAALKWVRQYSHQMIEKAEWLKTTAVKQPLVQFMHWAHHGLNAGQDYRIAQEKVSKQLMWTQSQ